MKCEGADNPPCVRCQKHSFDCVIEKPSKERALTGEQVSEDNEDDDGELPASGLFAPWEVLRRLADKYTAKVR